MIRRIMQVEIEPVEDDPDTCVVRIVNPATDQVMITMYYEDTDYWLEGMK